MLATPAVIAPCESVELEFTTEVGGSNPKNYQIWYHRRTLLTLLPTESTTFGTELKYVSEVRVRKERDSLEITDNPPYS